MNKLFFGLVLLVLTSILPAQNNNIQFKRGNNCEEFPNQIDSMYVYNWNRTLNSWDPVTIWQYENSDGRQDRLLFIDAVSRNPVRAWNYYYDSSGNRNLEISTYWRNNTWVLTTKKESVFNEDNKIQNQLTSTWKNETWGFSSYYFTEYAEGRLYKATTQLKNPAGVLYDQSYSVYSYDNDRLSEVRIYKASDGSLTGFNQYFYNENKLSEFIISVQGGPDSENNTMVPSRKRMYYYDDYSLLREVIFMDWNGAEWVTNSKYVYYFKLDNAKKVALCHNGHTICVSVNAVKSHLAHGDHLGNCNISESYRQDKSSSHDKSVVIVPFTVYPNPARDNFTVKLAYDDTPETKRIELVDFYGKLIKAYNIKDNSELFINRGNLPAGKYYVKLVGKEVFSQVVIFE